MSTPCSIWWNNKPLMPPHTRRSRIGEALPELGDGEDAGAVKACFHALANAVDVLQFEAEQNLGQVVVRDDGKSVRLLEIGTDLAKKDVGRDADRAGEALADLLAQGALDLERQSRAASTWRSVPINRHAISSIDMTFSIGRQVSTAARMRS